MHYVISYPDLTLFDVVAGLGSRLCIKIPNNMTGMFLFCF